VIKSHTVHNLRYHGRPQLISCVAEVSSGTVQTTTILYHIVKSMGTSIVPMNALDQLTFNVSRYTPLSVWDSIALISYWFCYRVTVVDHWTSTTQPLAIVDALSLELHHGESLVVDNVFSHTHRSTPVHQPTWIGLPPTPHKSATIADCSLCSSRGLLADYVR